MDILIPCASVAATISSGVVAYEVVRPWFSIKVNCWFCNKNTIVPYGNRNCWDCPHCDQYNGFLKDGSYNKAIPAQHDDLLNYPISADDPKEPYTQANNGLCELCNRNQLLKMKQLAAFVPHNEANFDSEIESFKQNLEHTYRLCRNCQASVCHKLARQDHKLRSTLFESRLKDCDTSSLYNHITCKVHTPLHVALLRFTSLLCAVTLLLVNTYNLNEDSTSKMFTFPSKLPKGIVRYIQVMYVNAQTLVFLGLFSGIGAIFLHGKYSLYLIDAMCCFTWLGLIVLHSGVTYLQQLPGVELAEIYLLQTGVALFCAFLSLWCAICQRMPNVRQRSKRRKYNLDGSNMSCDSSFAASQAGSFSLASDYDTFDALSQSSFGGSQFIGEDEDKVDNQLDGLSLGTPQKRTQHGGNSGVYSSKSAFATPPPSLASLSMRKNRPLISPARFSPSVQKKLSTLFKSDNSVAGQSNNDGANKAETETNDHSSSSSSSSQCPVGTTTHIDAGQRTTTGGKFTWSHFILIASVAVNIALVVYLAGSKLKDFLFN